jgi:HpiC1 cyclase
MKRKLFGFFSVFAVTHQLIAADLITDPIEADTTWTLGQTENAYLPAVAGLTPTAGLVMMHFNSDAGHGSYGTSFVNYTNKFALGTYIARIDVGSFDNQPLATIGSVGLTAGGQLLTPDSSSTPTPAPGEFRTWVFAYTNSLTSSNTTIGFRISVPVTSQDRNIAFDNLRIEFIPKPDLATNTVSAAIYHAVEVCWESETNKTYKVQWSVKFAPLDWHDLGLPLPGTGTNICVFDSARGQPQKVYRIQVLP